MLAIRARCRKLKQSNWLRRYISSQQVYLQLLRERLNIEGPNGLLEKSIRIADPINRDGAIYDKCCRIDFAGVSASNLFDAGQNIVPTSVADCLEDLFVRAKVLNDKGIFIKLRFLLVYPYSAHAFTRMQAESTRNRASMNHPKYKRDLSIIESVDEDMFKQSSFVQSQSLMLEQLQEWVDRYEWSRTSLNRAVVRFAPMSVNVCTLIVNDTIFADAYLLAKESRASKRCASLAPLAKIDKTEDQDTFNAFEDHFRYLWDLDLTLDCEDATYYHKGLPNSLKQIKSPSVINYESKAIRIKDKNVALTEEDIQKWKFKVSRLLNRYCMIPAPTPRSESLFITCSWERGADQRSVPNSQAQELSVMLETDFGRMRNDPLLSVHIMEGVAGEFLTRQLYARLEESTLGLVLMTADIESKTGQSYCKPNIYHELGYLMKQLTTDRVILICEEGITIPSNINDVIRVEFPKGKLVLCYREILRWLAKACSFNASVMRDVVTAHNERLNKMTLDGKLSQTEAQAATKKIQKDINAYQMKISAGNK